MSWHRGAGLLFLLWAGTAVAESYVAALGAEADTETSRAVSAAGELGVGENTWLSAAVAASRSDGSAGRFDALYADAGLDHFFEPVGVRVAVAYWGDSEALDSVDLRTSLYVRSDRASLSADFERREYDLVVGPPLLLRPRTLEFSAEGIGFTGSLQALERLRLYAGAMWYDYSDTASAGARDLRFLSLSRLVLAHGMLDRKAHTGVEIDFGPRSLDFRYARWTALTDQGSIDSIGIGFVTPLGAASDIELRLSRDQSNEFGDSVVFSVFLYLFGG